MDKNFYEILEVDKKASPEVIKKAYNTLAKKYHPDLQSGERRIEYGEKLKLINEAYETLSDASKRKEYDETLVSESATLQEKIDALSRENEALRSEVDRLSWIQFSNKISVNRASLNNNLNYSQQNAQKYTHYNDNSNFESYDENNNVNNSSFLSFLGLWLKGLLVRVFCFMLFIFFIYIILRLLVYTSANIR